MSVDASRALAVVDDVMSDLTGLAELLEALVDQQKDINPAALRPILASTLRCYSTLDGAFSVLQEMGGEVRS